jgi:hypothetical protein
LAAQTRPGKSASLLQQASGRSDVAHALCSSHTFQISDAAGNIAVADGREGEEKEKEENVPTLVAHPPDPPRRSRECGCRKSGPLKLACVTTDFGSRNLTNSHLLYALGLDVATTHQSVIARYVISS